MTEVESWRSRNAPMIEWLHERIDRRRYIDLVLRAFAFHVIERLDHTKEPTP